MKQLESCSICVTNDANVIYEPCGHSATCQDCLIKWLKESYNCPICKTQINTMTIVVRE